MMMYRRTFARVNLAAYKANVRAAKRLAGPGIKLMAVVKADAYGHGLVPIAGAAQVAGADWLGVALAEEGEALRMAGIWLPILILGPVNEVGAAAAVKNNLTMTVFTPAQVMMARQAAQAADQPALVHVKIDTGMNRIGIKTQTALAEVLQTIKADHYVELTGAFTHFADGDNPDTAFTDTQLSRFQQMLTMLPRDILVHAAASSMLPRADARFNMVRPGIALYGCPPVPYGEEMLPVMSWKAEITHVKEIGPGEAVGYGVTFHAEKPMRLATLAVGYGDGYPRCLSNRAQVLVGGRRCAVVGRVCMDQMMVDVTEAMEAAPGGHAVLLGSQGDQSILADELAGLAGTISYEVLLGISPRVPRIYAE
jgi:alanine racemase